MNKMFKDASAFIMRNLHKIQAGESINYPGKPEIPESVFEELLVNALSHRDYLINAPIRLFMFDNRIEIISPGHLPNNLTVEKIKAGNTNIRNPILVSYIAKGILPYKGLGSGIKRALENWPAIEFKDDREGCIFSALTFRKEVLGSGEVRNKYFNGSSLVREKLDGAFYSSGKNKFGKTSERIFHHLKLDPNITISILAEELGISTRAVEKQLAGLKKANRIRRIGPNKGGYWEVME